MRRHSFSVKTYLCWFRSCHILISSKLKATMINFMSCVLAAFGIANIAGLLFHENKPFSCINSSPDPLLR